MLRVSRFLAVMILSIGLPSAVIALEPLERFSNEVGVVVRLKAPKATIGKAAQFADAVQPGLGETVRQTAPGLARMIALQSMAGVDRSRDWYVFTFMTPGELPKVVFAIPTTDADELKQAINDDMTVEIEGDWAYYTASDDGVPNAQSADATVTSVLTGELADVFQRGDLSLFVNASHLTKLYADEIQTAHEQAHAGLEQIATFRQPQSPGMDLQAVVEMYSSLLNGLFQMVDDAGGSSVAITISAKQIGIEKYTTFADGSATAENLAAQPTSTMDALAKQTVDAVGYFGISCDMHRMIEWSMTMTKGLLGSNLEQEQAFEAAARAWQEIDFKEMSGSLSIGSAEQGLLLFSIYAQATPVDQIRKSMHEYVTSLGNIEVGGMKQTTTLQEDAETIDSRPVDIMTIKQEFPPELDPTGTQSRIQKLMYGPDGIVARIAYLDDGYVQTMGGGRKQMESALKAIVSTPNAALAQHREGLIDRSNLLLLFDLPNTVVRGLQSADEMPNLPFEIDTDELMQLDIDTSYVGVALAAEEDALRSKVIIPVDQVRGIVSLVNFFRTQRKP